jgi:ketosteroid isomerase-like protein
MKPARFLNVTSRLGVGCLLILLQGCSGQAEQQAVAAVAAARQQAMVSHDLPRYLELISPAYHDDKGLDYAAKARQVTSTFQSFAKIDFRIDNQQITISGGTATVRETYLLRTKLNGEELTLNGEEVLQLRREQSGWKIVGGL